jgi:hypothetical protein
MPPAILFSQMEPPAEQLDRFHHWYDTDHIPARMVLPGYRGARRFQALDGSPEYLAIYELDSLDALKTEGYQEVKTSPSALTKEMLSVVNGFTRFTCEQVSDLGEPVHGSYLSVVAFAVPDSDVAEFDAWYEDEHVAMLLEAKDWLRVRRYRVVDGEGGPWTHLALHELASTEVMNSPERAKARRGPLRDQLASQPWFGESGRWLYRQLSAVTAKADAAANKPGEVSR